MRSICSGWTAGICAEWQVKRKERLKALIPAGLQVLYLDHLEERGIALYDLACQHDMEGIIGKWKRGRYDQPSWFKIKNPRYSQVLGRSDKFEGRKFRPAIRES